MRAFLIYSLQNPCQKQHKTHIRHYYPDLGLAFVVADGDGLDYASAAGANS